jgi:hypothetical protein
MQFQVGDNVRLKPSATTQSTAGFELGATVMKIVRFESDNAAFCTWLQRGKAQFRFDSCGLMGTCDELKLRGSQRW